MKFQNLIIAAMMFLPLQNPFAQEIPGDKNDVDSVYFTLKETEIGYYWTESFPNNDNYTGILTISEFPLEGKYFRGGPFGKAGAYFLYLVQGNKELEMLSNSLESIHKKDSFDSDLLTGNNTEQDIWINSYYLEALKKQNRDIVYQHQKKHWDYYMTEIASKDYYMGDFWYEEFNNIRKITFNNNGLRIEGFYLLVDSITKQEKGYTVKVLGDDSYLESYEWMKSEMPFPVDGATKFFTLILEFDGDYLDVYLNDKNIKFAQFVIVDRDYARIISELVNNNTMEPIELPWPRRASGAMDYPPPVDMSNYEATPHD